MTTRRRHGRAALRRPVPAPRPPSSSLSATTATSSTGTSPPGRTSCWSAPPSPQEGRGAGRPHPTASISAATCWGLILGKLAFSPLWPPQGADPGGRDARTHPCSLPLLPGRAGERPGIPLPWPLFLVVWAPWGIWQQVYSWSAAWANYLPPPCSCSPLLLLLRQGPGPLAPRPAPLPVHRSVLPASIIPPIWSSLLLRYGSGRDWSPPLRGLLPAPVSPGRPAGRQLGRAGPEHDPNSVFAQVDSGLRGVGAGSGPGQPACHLCHRGPPPPHSPLCLTISLLLLWLVRRQGCPPGGCGPPPPPLHLYIG